MLDVVNKFVGRSMRGSSLIWAELSFVDIRIALPRSNNVGIWTVDYRIDE